MDRGIVQLLSSSRAYVGGDDTQDHRQGTQERQCHGPGQVLFEVILRRPQDRDRGASQAGNGQHTKALNQIINANTMMGISEALAYAHKAGLDIDTVMKSVTKGSAASFHLTNTAPKMAAGDFQPGFKLEHMIKDLEIAIREAESFNLELSGTEVVLKNYRRLASEGDAEEGVQALYKIYRHG